LDIVVLRMGHGALLITVVKYTDEYGVISVQIIFFLMTPARAKIDPTSGRFSHSTSLDVDPFMQARC
jgi:hypothetical protein